MSKILFVTPPYSCWGVQTIGNWPPLQLAYLAGSLRDAGFRPRIHDAMSRFEDLDAIRATLRDAAPSVVGVTACTATVNAALDVLRAAKQELPGVVTVIGGVHPTHRAAEGAPGPSASSRRAVDSSAGNAPGGSCQKSAQTRRR